MDAINRPKGMHGCAIAREGIHVSTDEGGMEVVVPNSRYLTSKGGITNSAASASEM